MSVQYETDGVTLLSHNVFTLLGRTLYGGHTMSSSSSSSLLSRKIAFPAGMAPLPASHLTPRLIRGRTAFMALSPRNQDRATEFMLALRLINPEQELLRIYATLSSHDRALIQGLAAALQPTRSAVGPCPKAEPGPRRRERRSVVAAFPGRR
jgi:hypothetical protein